MNWFKNIKTSQIWKVNYNNNDLLELIPAIYELTYKYQRLSNSKFNGLEIRKNNILSNLENSAKEVTRDICSILRPIFADWLKTHALTNPKQWAEARVDEIMEIYGEDLEEISESITNVYADKEIDSAISNNQALNFKRWTDQFKIKLLEDENISDEDKNDKEYFENLTFSEIFETYFESSWYFLLESISEYENIYDFIVELYEFTLFPNWYKHWKPQGIDKTRENVENAFKLIDSAPNQTIGQSLISINIIFNTLHQSGSMLEYISMGTGVGEDEIEDTLNYYSNLSSSSEEMKKWNKDLRLVGLKIKN